LLLIFMRHLRRMRRMNMNLKWISENALRSEFEVSEPTHSKFSANKLIIASNIVHIV
jgi:hypothetical protein